MARGARAAVAAAGLAGALAGCGDDLVEPPVTVERDGVRITVHPAPARFVVERAGDGLVVLDGLPGGAAGTPAAPHVAIAFRHATAEIETQVGSFRFEDDRRAPWTGIETLRHVRRDGAGIAFELAAGGERIGAGSIAIEDGDVRLVVEAHPWVAANRASIAYRCGDDERILGLGGQSFDVDHRGHTVPLWVEEDGITKRDDDRYEGVWFLQGRRHSTHTPMPMMLSSRGFAAAVDTDARAIFALCSEPDATTGEVVRLETWERRLDLRLFVPPIEGDRGAELRAAIGRMTAWVGRPPIPPAFAFAPWLDAVHGQDEVRRVARKLRDEDIPVSVIWTEDWRGGNDEATGYVLEEDWRVDRGLYPDFEALADELHGDGYKFLVYHNTFLDSDADVFDEAIALGHTIRRAGGEPYLFTGVKFRPATMLDLTSPAAVAWAKAIYDEAYALGADGWMADFAEWLPHDAVLASGEDPLLHHNRYPVAWARLNLDLIEARAGDGVERLTFMRAAWLGSQPLVQVIWAGDQQTDFTIGDGLPSVIPMGIGLGITGFPYYGHDIAGYMSQLTVPATKELWFRWCTLGALAPVMRTHHGRDARNNWSWERDDETIAHLRRWAKLHMQLGPYLHALAVAARDQGLPPMRAIALHYPELPWAWTVTDQYLLGDRLLVAPVVVEGATARAVRLPPGAWYPLLGGAPLDGGPAGEAGRVVTVDAPVTELPAYLAAGSLLALYPPEVDTVVAAPAAPATVTPADLEVTAILDLVPGAPPPGAEVNTIVSDELWFWWSGRDPALPPPATARIDGGPPVPLVAGPGYVALRVTGFTRVELDGGGLLDNWVADDGRTYELRLRTP